MKFVCKYNDCNAKCCRNIRCGSVPYSLNKKRSIHFLVKPENAGISVLNFEKDKILLEAKKLGVKLDIKPLSIVISKDGPLILNYYLNHDSCPLVKENNACSIYDARPLTCKLFPVMPPGIMSSECPYAIPDTECESYMYYKLKEYITLVYNNAIKSLVSKGLIKELITSSVIKKIKNATPIEDFLIKNNALSKELLKKLIEMNDSPEKLKEFILKTIKY